MGSGGNKGLGEWCPSFTLEVVILKQYLGFRDLLGAGSLNQSGILAFLRGSWRDVNRGRARPPPGATRRSLPSSVPPHCLQDVKIKSHEPFTLRCTGENVKVTPP